MVILPRTPVTVGTSPVVKAISTDYLARWHLLFTNSASSPGNVTAVRYRRYAIPSGNPGPWETFTLSTPLLAGESAAIRETDDCSAYVDVEFTCSAADCVLELEMGGPSARNMG